MYRNEELKIKMINLGQADMKFEVPQWLLGQFLPSASKSYQTNM